MPLLATLFMLFATTIITAISVPLMVRTPDAPLRLETTTSGQTDFLQAVTLTNVSQRTVTSYQLGVIMAIPSGCGAQTFIGQVIPLAGDHSTVVPGAEVTNSNYRMPPSVFYKFGEEHHGRVVSQLAVLQVSFEDGTSWSFQRSGDTFDDEQMARQAASQCKPTS